jgi:Uncharacterized conserved protein
MTLHTMFYSNEIRAAESIPTDNVEVKEQEKKLAEQLIASLAAPFEPQKYRDEYQENVRALIAAKLKGQEVTEVAQPHLAPVIDLMEALKKVLRRRKLLLLPPRRLLQGLFRWGRSLPREPCRQPQLRSRRGQGRSWPDNSEWVRPTDLVPKTSSAFWGSPGSSWTPGTVCAWFLRERIWVLRPTISGI